MEILLAALKAKLKMLREQGHLPKCVYLTLYTLRDIKHSKNKEVFNVKKFKEYKHMYCAIYIYGVPIVLTHDDIDNFKIEY